jgi:hypothetical protein
VPGKEQNFLLDIVLVRLIFAVTLTLVAYRSHPFGFQGPLAIAVGLISAVGNHLRSNIDSRAQRLKRLIGAAIVSIMESSGASLISQMLTRIRFSTQVRSHSSSSSFCF